MTSVCFDYSKLRGRIKEKMGSESRFADKIGISSVSLSARLNNRIGFSNEEISKTCEVLEISIDEVGTYFLMPKN